MVVVVAVIAAVVMIVIIPVVTVKAVKAVKVAIVEVRAVKTTIHVYQTNCNIKRQQSSARMTKKTTNRNCKSNKKNWE